MSKIIKVCARDSPLSRAQVQEVQSELQQIHPEIVFDVTFVKTTGDLDHKTSLKTMGQTDFFTKEIDQIVLQGVCRLGIHSAKDLPEPLAKGLKLCHLTKGLDPSDCLVLRPGECLREKMNIATSSFRREESVRQLVSNATFVEVRGTIGERLEFLRSGKIDAIVMAECALIRLGLTALNRIKIPGETAPLQGRLACVSREDDIEMDELFSCAQKDSRRMCRKHFSYG